MIGVVEAARVCYHAGGRGCLPRDGGCPNVRPYNIAHLRIFQRVIGNLLQHKHEIEISRLNCPQDVLHLAGGGF